MIEPALDQRRSEPEKPHSARYAALIMAVAVFATLTAMCGFLLIDDENYRGLFLVSAPILMVAASLISNYRPLIWATIAVCFMIGVVGMFSIGIPIFIMGVCLLAWDLFKSSGRRRRPFDWTDVLIANLIVFPFVLYIASIVLRINQQSSGS